jgi:hypothetical protein
LKIPRTVLPLNSLPAKSDNRISKLQIATIFHAENIPSFFEAVLKHHDKIWLLQPNVIQMQSLFKRTYRIGFKRQMSLRRPILRVEALAFRLEVEYRIQGDVNVGLKWRLRNFQNKKYTI